MIDPVLFGYPLSELFFYFMLYSMLGWAMETVYCSIGERKFASRGFLYGPICPIYGVGVLMMICWFQPLMDRPVVFYLVATVCMSTWEYLVGWFLEVTTHIKYWDYSMFRFNLHGRICLWVCLTWGALSFLVLYGIQPWAKGLYQSIAGVELYFLDGFLLGALLFDVLATVHQLVRTTHLLARLQKAGDDLKVQISLGKTELVDRLEEWMPDPLDEAGRMAKARYEELVASTEIVSRRFRNAFHTMHSRGPVSDALESVKRRGERVSRLVKGMVLKDPDGQKTETGTKND